ncbi:hypothetical protein HMPREF3038_01195 [Akkermansia sp. KLE1797]|nr:hypothetical protein HMPREF3038_01195 [Akkermansia sp. KLE1797]
MRRLWYFIWFVKEGNRENKSPGKRSGGKSRNWSCRRPFLFFFHFHSFPGPAVLVLDFSGAEVMKRTPSCFFSPRFSAFSGGHSERPG